MTVSRINMASRPYTFDRVVRMLITLAMVAAAVWLINVLRDVLLPFCVAALISYFLEPLVQFVRRLLHLRGRAVAIFITLLGTTLFIALVTYLFLPSVIREINQMSQLIRTYSARYGSIPFVPDEVHDFIRRNVNLDRIAASMDGQSVDTIISKVSDLLAGSLDFLLHTVEWLLTFIYVIFILLDYDRLTRGLRLLVPPKYRRRAYRIGNDIKDSMNRYFRGQALLALCAMVFYCIGFSIVGIPLAIILGLTVGLLYMIPYFQYITVIPVFFVCMVYSLGGHADLWVLLGECGLVYVVSQCICDYVLTPKIMGKALGLNPAIILLSLSVWGTLLGIIGMIIALPLTTLCLSYYQQYVIDPGGADNAKDTEGAAQP